MSEQESRRGFLRRLGITGVSFVGASAGGVSGTLTASAVANKTAPLLPAFDERALHQAALTKVDAIARTRNMTPREIIAAYIHESDLQRENGKEMQLAASQKNDTRAARAMLIGGGAGGVTGAATADAIWKAIIVKKRSQIEEDKTLNH